MRKNGVKTLLMGGQACVLYGAVQFSKDVDLLVFADPENLKALSAALADLQASKIAVPDFDATYLDRGHAVHFRCQREDLKDLRIDVMSRLRDMPPFEVLWSRRTEAEFDGELICMFSVPDLVNSKKTQREKDWPMIATLVEVNFIEGKGSPTPERIAFWLSELRSPQLLVELAEQFPEAANACARPALRLAMTGNVRAAASALRDEQDAIAEIDAAYWRPLRAELELLRQQR